MHTQTYCERSIVSLCAENAVVENKKSSGTVSIQSSGTCLSNSRLIRTPTWDSLRRAPLDLPPLGLGRPLRGLCALSDWLNRLRDSAAITTTSAFPKERWATHPLTHQVSSRGQTGGKWGRPVVGEFVLSVTGQWHAAVTDVHLKDNSGEGSADQVHSDGRATDTVS